jgi:cytochrome c
MQTAVATGATTRSGFDVIPARRRVGGKGQSMRIALFTFWWALAAFGLAAYPLTAAAATPEQAQALSERAAAYLGEVGVEKAFAAFTNEDGGFVDGELYVFCYDHYGVVMANGGSPSLVGRNLMHMKDTDGAEPTALGINMGFEKGRGWINFKWPNPETKRIERKSAYVIRTADIVCGVGYYEH